MYERKALYSPSEVAELAGLSTSTILSYINSGKLYAVKLSERTYRIPYASVIATFFPDKRRPPTFTRGSDAVATAQRWEREWEAEHKRPKRRRKAQAKRATVRA